MGESQWSKTGLNLCDSYYPSGFKHNLSIKVGPIFHGENGVLLKTLALEN